MMPRMQADYSDKNPQLGALYADHIATVQARYDHALAQSEADCVVIFSGAPHPVFLDDTYYPFCAAANFVCWLPVIDAPYCYVIYRSGETPTLVYYQPKDYWHVVPGDPDGYWTGHFDIRVVHDRDGIRAAMPADTSDCVFIGEAINEAAACGIAMRNPTAFLDTIHYARGRKTPYELECLRLASRRGVAGHLAAKTAFENGLSEIDIHRDYCTAVGHTDAELPYGNIVALNEHAAILHYTVLQRTAPAESRSFLIDAGAQVHGYASDITRTYDKGSAEFAALIERMDALQLDIVSRVRAGVDYRELHLETHRQVAAVLLDAGIASGSADALLELGVTAKFYPHGLGHLLGAQVHDVGGHFAAEDGSLIDPPEGHPFLRLTRTLETDMVITVEPGLYIIDMLLDELRGGDAEKLVNWSAVDRLRPFGGIRIEDDVRVLDDGCENLTRDAFAAG